jgi:ubiquinone/menaquinone biosynthesis C-methylase UbiE
MMCNRLHLQHGHNKTVASLTYSKYIRLHKALHAPPLDPTPQAAVDGMLAAVDLSADDVLYDLGCGDGRILIAAVTRYGCRAVGIEINSKTAALAKKNVKAAGVEDWVRIVEGDARDANLVDATVVTLYLSPSLMRELVPKIERATRIVSYSHPIPGRQGVRLMIGGRYPVYLWAAGSCRAYL